MPIRSASAQGTGERSLAPGPSSSTQACKSARPRSAQPPGGGLDRGARTEPGRHLSLSKALGENAPPFLDREPRERMSVPCAEECGAPGSRRHGVSKGRARVSPTPASLAPEPALRSFPPPRSSSCSPLSADLLGTGGLAGGQGSLWVRRAQRGLRTSHLSGCWPRHCLRHQESYSTSHVLGYF